MSDRDGGSDIPTLFSRHQIYHPIVTNITPVPSDHDSEEEIDDNGKESPTAWQSRFDKFEAERQFKHELELAKLASLGISSTKNKVTTGKPVKGLLLATKRKISPSPTLREYKIPKVKEDLKF